MSRKQKLTKLQKEWLKALRSGRYKQVRDELCNRETGGYCCLGVAARVAGIPKKSLVSIGDLSECKDLEPVVVKMRLRDGSGMLSVPYNETYNHLTGMNDTAKLSFKQIADYIEENPESVFLPPKKRTKKA